MSFAAGQVRKASPASPPPSSAPASTPLTQGEHCRAGGGDAERPVHSPQAPAEAPAPPGSLSPQPPARREIPRSRRQQQLPLRLESPRRLSARAAGCPARPRPPKSSTRPPVSMCAPSSRTCPFKRRRMPRRPYLALYLKFSRFAGGRGERRARAPEAAFRRITRSGAPRLWVRTGKSVRREGEEGERAGQAGAGGGSRGAERQSSFAIFTSGSSQGRGGGRLPAFLKNE